jgi:hypothetical protein
MELTKTVVALDTTVTPQIYNGAPGGYVFLRMNFNCLTGSTLIRLFTLEDLGLTFVHQRDGYAHIFIRDFLGRSFPVNMISECWLAAVVPPDTRGITLFYNGFLFRPEISLSGP